MQVAVGRSSFDPNQGVFRHLRQCAVVCSLQLFEATMPDEVDRPDCLAHAAHWRRRALATDRAELRSAYERIAESYEALSRQALLCRRLVSAIASQRGEVPRCCCDAALTAGPELPEVATASE